jgi:predicted RNase H-like HicB family nuclease
MTNDNLEDLKALDYPLRIEYDDEDGLFVAEFLDLPGCSATGSTVAEAYERAQEAKAEWLRVTLDQGLPVPKSSKARDYSGRILVRLPVSLHATLADGARANGASLNQYIVHLLSAGAVGDQLSSKLEAMTGQLRELEWRVTTGFQGDHTARAIPNG